MKRIVGYMAILLSLPLLFFIQQGIVGELGEAQAMKTQLFDAVQLKKPNYDLPITMQDQHGHSFSEVYIEWRTPISLSNIPIFIQYLFIESEDAEFYQHRGYDASAIVRAFIVNAKTDEKRQGASTITQQLIRMQYLTTDKTYERKVVELLYAAELEKNAAKEEILESYLNEMYFANRVYGIGSAATYYFDRALHELNPAEMAFIAAIPNNPQKYDPLVNFNATKERQVRLLDMLAKRGFITKEENEEYKTTPIQLNIKTKTNNFPAYSDYVLQELEVLIENSEGFSQRLQQAKSKREKETIQDELHEKVRKTLQMGITIETALNPQKQAMDTQALNGLLQTNGLQAGAAVIDNDSREIVSMYGGSNYSTNQFNRSYQAYRQPGSALKPLLVYAPLFENSAYHPGSIVNSGPICIENYCPKNVGGHVYGNTTIQEAFRHSHNTTAVRLLQQVGIEEAFSHLEPFQFKAISRRDMNFPAALGGLNNGVTPLELASAYTSFVDGTYTPPRTIRTVKDREGTILYEWHDEPTTVWSVATTKMIRSLLQDVVLNGTARGIPINTSFTGVKTGTTDDYRDLWTAGLNDRYTTAVWLGYDTPSSIQFASEKKQHLQAIRHLLGVEH